MEEREYVYDAFISYRHLPLDKAVAVRLQELLESYKPPKGAGTGRIRRVFRDQSELPTSGDLGADINEALESSRYLVVVCSTETKNSAWCMEEIRRFRQLHDGRNDRILAVLVQGEPHEAFPEELMYETHRVTRPDGTVIEGRRPIEPLSADVRSDSVRGSLKLLKTEFLRVAAPVLGCGFDDLYRRHERRKRKRMAAVSGSAAVILSAVIAVISVFAWRTYVSEQNYQSTLADFYTSQGVESADEGELQDALLYYASAIALEPEEQRAAVMGAALLLEQNTWPYVAEEGTGRIIDGMILEDEAYSASEYAVAAAQDGTVYLVSLLSGYAVTGLDGSSVSLDGDVGTYTGTSADGSYWVFCSDEEISFYDTSDGTVTSVTRPADINPLCEDEDYSGSGLPAAFPTGDGRAVAVYGGYVYLYEMEGDSWTQKATVDLGDIFSSDAGDLDTEGYLWMSDDGSLAVVQSGFGIAAFDTEDLTLKSTSMGYKYILNDVVFNEDASRFALVFGNTFGLSYYESGGYIEVYDSDGGLLFETEVDSETPYVGAAFSPDDSSELLAWSNNSLMLWDLDSQSLTAVPAAEDWIETAAYDSDGNPVTDDGDGNLTTYGLVSFSAASATEGGAESTAAAEETAESTEVSDAEEISIDGASQAFRVSDDVAIARSASRVWLLDGNENELDEAAFETALNDMLYVQQAGAAYVYQQYSTYLYMVGLSADQTEIRDVVTLDTRGGLVQEIYAFDESLAVLTGSGQVLLYSYGDADPELVISLEHGGVVQEINEIDGGYMTVYIRTNQSDTDTYHIDMEETVELWDLETGVHIADLDTDEAYLASQELPVPDDDAVAFLTALSGSTFDDSQNISVKQPTLESDSLGTWGDALTVNIIGTEQTESGEAAEDEVSENETSDTEVSADEGSVDELELLVNEYSDGPEEGNESGWFAECDEIWDALVLGEITYTGNSLDDWFWLYKEQASESGCLDEIADAVNGYLTVVTEHALDEAMDDSWYDHYLLLLMIETEEYDGIIITGFETIADCYEEAVSGQEDLDALTESGYVYQMMGLRCYSDLLSGEGEESFAAFEEDGVETMTGLLREAYDELGLSISDEDLEILEQMSTVELSVNAMLFRGEAEEAAALSESCMQYRAENGWDDDEILLYQAVHQAHIYLLAKRGIISQECLNLYMESLPLYSGIRISQLSTEAQQLGLMMDDIIIAADGNALSCVQQAEDLLNDAEEVTLTVIRDEETVIIEKYTSAGYGGYFETVFRDEEDAG